MSQESTSGKDHDPITSDDLLGKDVIDSEGKFIGVSEKVLIDSEDLELIGIEIDKGFFKKGYSLGKEYVSRVTPFAIFLSIQIAYDLKGKIVFDKNGKEIGKVIDVILAEGKNVIKSIVVSTGLFGEKLEIPQGYIKTKDRNIILKVDDNFIFPKNAPKK